MSLKNVEEVFMHYKVMEKFSPNGSMIRQVQMQYSDMANGGDGGELGFTPDDFKGSAGEYGPSCREYNYKDYPDEFFQEVCALMGWEW
mgnify:CR=1 FL=1